MLSTKYVYQDIESHIEVKLDAILKAEECLKDSDCSGPNKAQSATIPCIKIFVNRSDGAYQTAEVAQDVNTAKTTKKSRIIAVKLERRNNPDQRDPSAFVKFYAEPAGRVRYLLDETKGKEMHQYVLNNLENPVTTRFSKITDFLLAASLLILEFWCYKDCSQAQSPLLSTPVGAAVLTLVPLAVLGVLQFRPLYRLWCYMVPSVFLIGAFAKIHERRKRNSKIVFTAFNTVLTIVSIAAGIATILLN